MIRLRKANGEAEVLSEAHKFVEICDDSGLVASVFFMDDKGTIRRIDATDKDATRYEKLFGTKFCPIIRLKH